MPNSKGGRNWVRNYHWIFPTCISIIHQGIFLTCCKILEHGDDCFTSPLKEFMLHIFIALKNPLLSAGFEPTNLQSNGKHDNHDHYTAEYVCTDMCMYVCVCVCMCVYIYIYTHTHTHTHTQTLYILYFCIEKQIEALKSRDVKLNVYVKGCSFHLLKKNVYHSGPPLPPPPHTHTHTHTHTYKFWKYLI
jgi:hypothetical protein